MGGGSNKNLTVESDPLCLQVVMNMEWRPEYTITVSRESKSKESSPISVSVSAPASSASSYGIYNHFVVSTDEGGQKVKIVPRFLFGLPYDTVDEMYGKDVDQFPIVGVFTESPRFDRIIIQAYMNIVTLSVIFLLWANNPPSSISRVIKKD